MVLTVAFADRLLQFGTVKQPRPRMVLYYDQLISTIIKYPSFPRLPVFIFKVYSAFRSTSHDEIPPSFLSKLMANVFVLFCFLNFISLCCGRNKQGKRSWFRHTRALNLHMIISWPTLRHEFFFHRCIRRSRNWSRPNETSCAAYYEE